MEIAMTYRIRGLDPAPFQTLFGVDATDDGSGLHRTVIADSDSGFPCRVSLEDARAGERLVLTHHVSHDVATPFRSAFAIYVREGARRADYVDDLPPVFAGRPISLRGYDAEGMLKAARLAPPGQAEGAILDLFADERIAYIDAHNAAHGCFAARVDRYDSDRV
jgi:hypothetical protein